MPLSFGPLPIGVLPWLLGTAVAWLLAKLLSARGKPTPASAAADADAAHAAAAEATADTGTDRVSATSVPAAQLPPAPGAGSVLLDMLFIGVLVARAAFVLLALRSYLREPLTMLMIGDGGFLLWPGLLAAFAYAAWRLRRQRLPRRIVLGSAAAGVLLALLLGQLLANARRDAPPLPATAFARLDTAPLALLPGDGRPTVINLWATWCPPCRRELPAFVRAQRDWPGVRFVFADQGEAADTVRAFLPRAGLNTRDVLLDADSSLMQRYQSRALPTTLFFDADGRLLEAHLGPLSDATLALRLRRLAATGAR